MSDIQKAIDIIQRIQDCYLYQECDMDCIHCKHSIGVMEVSHTCNAAIAALQEKQHNDELRQKGLLVELPCAIGERVYRIVETGTYEVYTIMHEGHKYRREVPFREIMDCKFNLKLMDEFGETVFPAYEAAQEALWKMEKTEGRR